MVLMDVFRSCQQYGFVNTSYQVRLIELHCQTTASTQKYLTF